MDENTKAILSDPAVRLALRQRANIVEREIIETVTAGPKQSYLYEARAAERNALYEALAILNDWAVGGQ